MWELSIQVSSLQEIHYITTLLGEWRRKKGWERKKINFFSALFIATHRRRDFCVWWKGNTWCLFQQTSSQAGDKAGEFRQLFSFFSVSLWELPVVETLASEEPSRTRDVENSSTLCSSARTKCSASTTPSCSFSMCGLDNCWLHIRGHCRWHSWQEGTPLEWGVLRRWGWQGQSSSLMPA